MVEQCRTDLRIHWSQTPHGTLLAARTGAAVGGALRESLNEVSWRVDFGSLTWEKWRHNVGNPKIINYHDWKCFFTTHENLIENGDELGMVTMAVMALGYHNYSPITLISYMGGFWTPVAGLWQ